MGKSMHSYAYGFNSWMELLDSNLPASLPCYPRTTIENSMIIEKTYLAKKIE